MKRAIWKFQLQGNGPRLLHFSLPAGVTPLAVARDANGKPSLWCEVWADTTEPNVDHLVHIVWTGRELPPECTHRSSKHVGVLAYPETGIIEHVYWCDMLALHERVA